MHTGVGTCLQCGATVPPDSARGRCPDCGVGLPERLVLDLDVHAVLREPLCIYCRLDVDLLHEDLVLVGDARMGMEDRRWRFAHQDCHNEPIDTDEDPWDIATPGHSHRPAVVFVSTAALAKFHRDQSAHTRRKEALGWSALGLLVGLVIARILEANGLF